MQARLPTSSDNAFEQADITAARKSPPSDSTLESAVAASALYTSGYPVRCVATADAQLEQAMTMAAALTTPPPLGAWRCHHMDDAGLELSAAGTAGVLQTKPMRPICIADADAELERTAASAQSATLIYSMPVCRQVDDAGLKLAAAGDAALEQVVTMGTPLTSTFVPPGYPRCRNLDDAELELSAAGTAGVLQTKPMRPICIADADAELERSVASAQTMTVVPAPQYRQFCIADGDAELERTVTMSAPQTLAFSFPRCISSGDIHLEKSLSNSAQPTVKGWPYCVTDNDAALEQFVTTAAARTSVQPYLPCHDTGDAELERITLNSRPSVNPYVVHCSTGDAALEHAAVEMAARSNAYPPMGLPCVGIDDTALESMSNSVSPNTYSRTPLSPLCIAAGDAALERVAAAAALRTHGPYITMPCVAGSDSALEHAATDIAAVSIRRTTFECFAIGDAALELSAATAALRTNGPYITMPCVAEQIGELAFAAAAAQYMAHSVAH